MTTRTLSDLAGDDIIDSRDIIARRDELQGELAAIEEEQEDLQAELDGADHDGAEPGDKVRIQADIVRVREERIAWKEENSEELNALNAICSEGADASGDWESGETLIREGYFTDYAQELAEDCGMLPQGLSWPLTCIDWEKAANELKADYTTVTIEGDDYFVRSC